MFAALTSMVKAWRNRPLVQGARAARAGLPIDYCPFPGGRDRVAWLSGFKDEIWWQENGGIW